jgi:hypothetical protein
MQGRRIGFSCLALLAGLAAVAISTGDTASAAAGGGPVCAMRSDGPKWYPAAALAKKDGARIMHPGDCETLLCVGAEPKIALAMGLTHPTAICGIDPLSHARMTYPNDCAIEAAGATFLHAGPCR